MDDYRSAAVLSQDLIWPIGLLHIRDLTRRYPPRRGLDQEVAELLGRATEEEADFVKRLFTGELRQGALAGLMVDAISKAAGISGGIVRRALMLSGDLTRTAEIAMTTGEEGLRDVGFEIFRPILPMLASTAESVADAVASFEHASVEWKLDGIRIQIHCRGEDVRIYTRNLNDITHALPGIVVAVRRLPVRQAVFDGEALWMGQDGPAAFQDTVSRIDSEAPPEGIVTFLFDLLHVVSDAVGSVGAIIAGLVMLATEWYLADPIISILIGVLILHSSWSLVKESVSILMQAVPKGIRLEEVQRTIEEVNGVMKVHDLHVWAVTSGIFTLSAHAVVHNGEDFHEVLNGIEDTLKDRFNIEHVTIQLETESREEKEFKGF